MLPELLRRIAKTTLFRTALLACAMLGAPAAAQASSGARVEVGSRTISISAGQILSAGDVPATTYTLRQAPGQSQPITLHGISIRSLLSLAGIDPATVTSVTVGGASQLSPVDIADPPPFPQGPALITINGSTTRYFRPVRGTGDVNGSDYITTPPGQPIDVVVSGPPDVTTAASRLQVTATAYPTHASIGQTVFFAALVANPPSGVSLNYSWSFGDGAAAYGSSPTHTYAANGDYPATVTVSGSGSSGVSAIVEVHVGHPKRVVRGTGLGSTTKPGSGAGGRGSGHGGTGGGTATGRQGATQPKPTTAQPAQSAHSLGTAKAQIARAQGARQVIHGILLADAGSPFNLHLSPPPPSGGPGPAHASKGGGSSFPTIFLGLAAALAIATLGGLSERRRGTLSPA